MQSAGDPVSARYGYYRDLPWELGRWKRPIQFIGVAVAVTAIAGAGYYIGSLRPPPTVTLVVGTPNAAVVSRYDSPAEPGPNGLFLAAKLTVNNEEAVGKLAPMPTVFRPSRPAATPAQPGTGTTRSSFFMRMATRGRSMPSGEDAESSASANSLR